VKKLEDYSGDFNPDLKPSDFSYEALEKLIRTYSKLYKALDGFWYLALMEKRGNDEALACDILVWEKLCLYEMKQITRAFNITGKDVKSLMKAVQISPWAWNIKSSFEVINDNHIIWNVLHCPTVSALEREGRGRENDICKNVEPRLNRLYASFFNPDMQVNCLKTPPRESADDCYCRWEFKL
jgi:hypothetical protein